MLCVLLINDLALHRARMSPITETQISIAEQNITMNSTETAVKLFNSMYQYNVCDAIHQYVTQYIKTTHKYFKLMVWFNGSVRVH